MFKILYIHTLPHPSFTADETEEPRRKEARYQSIMRILKDRQEYRFLDNTLSSTFYNAQTPLVSVSAIVGENGQGKSSLIELMLRLINNMAYALRPAYAQANRSHPRFIRGVYAEFSFELNGNVYIIRNEDLNICCRVNDEKIWQYDYTQRNDESHGLTNIKTALPATEQDVHRWLSDLFYTIVVNYSSYSYNTNDYFPEHIEDEELDKDETRDSVTEEERCWLCGIFHKNDGYQMPIVLNPFRANGQIDYNNEIDLLQTRIYLLAISNNSPLASIYKDKKPKSFVFDILTDFSPTGPYLFTSIKTRLEMYYLHYISDWRHADEHAMDILGKRIVEVWSKCVGLNLNKCCKSKDEGSIRRTLNYIVYKTIKISLTYAKYKRYQEDVKNVDEELNGESGIEAYIKQLYLDNTHITLKIKRAIAWLIFAHYSTTMTKDKQGEKYMTDSEIPISLFAKRVEDRLKNKSRYINGANKNVMVKRYPDLPLHEWTVEELLPAPSFRSDLRFSLLDEFIKIYNATMDKDNAEEYYYFKPEFYRSIHEDLKDNYEMFWAEYEGKIIAMSIMIFANGRLNYHLSGSDIEYRNLAPSNLLLYKAALWGCEKGMKTFHLGGGVGSGEDNLFKFKIAFNRFSDYQFSIAKHIFDKEKYEALVEERVARDSDFNRDSKFFPVYRSLE